MSIPSVRETGTCPLRASTTFIVESLESSVKNGARPDANNVVRTRVLSLPSFESRIFVTKD